MSCFQTEDWSSLLDGSLARERGLHLQSCSICRAAAAEFTHVEGQICEAAQRVRKDTSISDRELREAFTRFRSRVQDRRSISSCLEALHCFLSGMLGAAAGVKVVQAAARKSPVDEASWNEFIARLAGMSADLCGEGAGSIISFIGTLAGPEPV